MVKMARCGIKTVAARAGVSIGTVSRVLNPDSRNNIQISEETRTKVLAAINELDYRPSYGAQLLRGQSSCTIGFANSLPMAHGDAFLSSYTFRLLKGIGRTAARYHYQVLLLQGDDYRHYLDVRRIDALIITGFPLNSNPLRRQMIEMFESFNAENYPYIVINNSLMDVKVPTISLDNEDGMRQIAELLIRKGYSSAGFIGELTPNPESHHTVRAEFLKKFLAGSCCRIDDRCILNGAENDIPQNPRTGRYCHKDGETAVRYLLEKNMLPRCIVCGNDDIAISVLRTAFELGIRVPEQLAVIGFDDDDNMDYLTPALTTVHQPLEEFGRLAVEYVLEKLCNPGHDLQLSVKPKLMERETT